MIKHFSVKNYKCFQSLDFDLTANDYAYNPVIVNNGIVSKALIYGKNGSGKTSLGLALFDVVVHLTDKQQLPSKHYANYLNLKTHSDVATFQYAFDFGCEEVIYEYAKSSANNLLWEKLIISGESYLDYSYTDASHRQISRKLAGQLNFELMDNRLSVLKYIYRNTPTGHLPRPFVRMMSFCDSMLWFRSLSDGNSYCGFTNGNQSLVEMLYHNGDLEEFKLFLKQNELDYDLHFEDSGGEVELWIYFDAGGHRKARFTDIASAGTMALLLFFNWMTYGKDRISFLFIDEFDAFYHYEVAAEILGELNREYRLMQTVLTTHNTHLMQNRLTRPDCCYILTNEKIVSLRKATKRELREAHNLENLYTNGAFCV